MTRAFSHLPHPALLGTTQKSRALRHTFTIKLTFISINAECFPPRAATLASPLSAVLEYMASEKERLDSIIQSLQTRQLANGVVPPLAAAETWDLLAAKFGSLIGASGVALLYGRSLERTRVQFAWLPPSV